MAYLSGYSKYKVLTLTGGSSGAQSNFQLKLAVSYEAAMDGEFDDIRFTQADGVTLIDAWAEVIVTDTSATVWVEFPSTPANTVEQTYYMYYDHATPVSDWDGPATFIQYHGAATAGFIDALNTPYTCVYEVRAKATSSAANVHFGVSSAYDRSDDEMVITLKKTTNVVGHACRNEGSETYISEAESIVVDQWYKGLVYNNGSNSYGYWDDDLIVGGITINRPNENIGLYMRIFGGTAAQDWSFSRKYASGPPTYGFGAEQSVPTGVAPTGVFYGPFHGPFGGPL